MKTIVLIGYVLTFLAAFSGITNWIGEEGMANFNEFMFRPYVDLYQKYQHQWSINWHNPYLIVVIIGLVLTTALSMPELLRKLAAVVVAFLIYKAALFFLTDTAAPSLPLIVFGLLATTWLIMTGFFKINLWQLIVNKYYQIRY